MIDKRWIGWEYHFRIREFALYLQGIHHPITRNVVDEYFKVITAAMKKYKKAYE